MKTIVIYTSKYGSTEKYAKWIAEALNCPAKKLSDVNAQELAAHEAIIYGGGIYAGSIAGFKQFMSRLNPVQNQKLALFMVGMTDPAEKDVYAKIVAQNIPSEWQNRFAIFVLHGDLLFSKMNRLHKLMMRMPKAMAEKKPVTERTAGDKHFIEHFGEDALFANKEEIEPILNYLQKD